jgi:hypothetical protein
VLARPGPSQAFDELVRAAVERLRSTLPGVLDTVQFGVEETPVLPDDWTAEVPLGTHVAAGRGRDARVVIYRLPVAQRARGRAETAALVLDVLVEEIADLLDRDPDEIDPR